MMIFLLAAAAHAACPTFAEPDGDWATGPTLSADAEAARAALEAYAFPDTLNDPERRGVRTDGLVIVRDGQVLYEHYGRDWTADQPHLLWSVSKSISATLVGMAVHEGLLDIDASICDTIEVTNPEACAVTTRNLMEHASGFAWRETYEGQSPTASSVVGMLYGAGMDDMAAFVTGHDLRDAPGTSFRYSTGDTMVQTAVAHKLLTERFGENYLEERLYSMLGFTDAQWETDRSGVPIGGSTLFLTPRDMARYGAFLLQDGCWNGERRLPEGWVARATTPASSVEGKHIKPLYGPLPGWDLWLNRPHARSLNEGIPWPDAPEDTFAALGHWYQSIYVLPSEGVVVARTADDRDGTFSHNALLARVMDLIDTIPAPGPAEPELPEAEPSPQAGTDAPEAESSPEAETDAPEAATDAPQGEPPPEAELAPLPEVRGFSPAAFPPVPLKPVADSVAEPPEKYDVGLLSIGTSFAALHGCSCRYISQRAEQACIDHIRITPDIARARFDDETQTVTARAFGLAKQQARPGPDGTGCRIIDP